MYLKTLRVQLKDLFVEMREEKQKLLKEIQLLKDFRNCLNSFVICCKCDQNVINGNKFIANQLENQYLTSFPTNLVMKNLNFDQIWDNSKEYQIKVIDASDHLINGFVEDEVIINENILEIDCRHMSDDFIGNENITEIDCKEMSDNCIVKEIQLEVIPKKEIESEIIDLDPEPEEPIVEQKYKYLVTNSNENVFNDKEPNVSIGTDPEISENRFSYLSSFVNQIKNCEKITSTENLNANNVDNNSGKTIVVEKNKKIFGFVCNVENCTEFYKSINGLQSHIDRVHNRSQSVNKPLPAGKELNSFKSSVKKSVNLRKVSPNKRRNYRRKSDSAKVDESNAEKQSSIDGKERPKNRLQNNSKYVCDKQSCRYSCGTKYQMLSHKVSKHKNGRHFRCKQPDCRLMFKSKFDVIQHLRMHSIKSTKDPKQTTDKELELWFKCGFSDCDLSFETRSQLKQHKIESKHIGVKKKDYKCSFKKCKRVFKSQFALNQHLRMVKHPLRSKVTKEVKTIQLDDKNIEKYKFKCSLDDCNKSFKSRFALNQHIRKSDHKSVLLFNQSKEIFYSVKNPISRFFKCSNIDCKEVFKHRFALNQHLKACKTREQPSKEFKCEIVGCKQEFANRGSLKYHIKSFHNLPPLRCRQNQCKSRFYNCYQKSKHFKKYHSSV